MLLGSAGKVGFSRISSLATRCAASSSSWCSGSAEPSIVDETCTLNVFIHGSFEIPAAMLDVRSRSPLASLLAALIDGTSSPLDSAAREPNAVGELRGTGKPQLLL